VVKTRVRRLPTKESSSVMARSRGVERPRGYWGAETYSRDEQSIEAQRLKRYGGGHSSFGAVGEGAGVTAPTWASMHGNAMGLRRKAKGWPRPEGVR